MSQLQDVITTKDAYKQLQSADAKVLRTQNAHTALQPRIALRGATIATGGGCTLPSIQNPLSFLASSVAVDVQMQVLTPNTKGQTVCQSTLRSKHALGPQSLWPTL